MRVVTSFAHRHWTEGLAREMVESFLAHWDGFELFCYVDGGIPSGLAEKENPRLTVIDFYKEVRACREFVQTYTAPLRPLIWYGDRYEYKWDAPRFAHKVFALANQEQLYGPKDLIWLDADVISHAHVTLEEVSRLVGDPLADVAYLGREGFAIEAGFMWFNLRRMGGDVIRAVARYYEDKSIFREPEWHDGYLWGKVIPHYYGTNISAGIKGKHVWPETPLARFCAHLKGPARKRARADLPDHVALEIPDQVTEAV